MGKYLELFRGEVGDLTEKTKLENKPYVAYSTKLGKVTYTVIPTPVKLQPDNEIWYVAGEPGRYYNTCDFHELNSENKPELISNTCENNKGVMVFDGPVTLIEGIRIFDINTLEERTISPFENLPDEGVYEYAHVLEITLPSTVNQLGYKAFVGCRYLTNIDLKNVQTIGQEAFYGCLSLTSIVIPDSVTSIGDRAFLDCERLTSITFEGTMKEWNSITKGGAWNYRVPATYVQCTDGQVTL